MHNTDKPPSPADQPNQPIPLVTLPMGFQHPPGFEPHAFLIIAIDKHGKHFLNMPLPQPHLCLHLATLALQDVSRRIVLHLQEAQGARSPIVQVPPGMSLPPWNGPAGRS